MKKLGIIRHIDDLGRIVIPKDVRKILNFKESDSLEFLINDKNELIIKKYELK